MPELGHLLNDIRAELDTVPNTFVQLQWNKLKFDYYLNTNDSGKALPYILAYNNFNDSFIEHNKVLMASDFNGHISRLERQHEINILQEERKERKERKIFSYIVLIIVLMAVIIITLILRYSAKAAKNVQMLTLLNDQVTEQKMKLENALNELEVKDKDKSRILRSVAHDVMSPISAVAALTDILIMESEDASEDHKEILGLIREACNNSLSLSRDILDAAVTIAPGKMAKEQVNINKLVSGCVELLAVRAAEKEQTLSFKSEVENLNAFVNKEKIWRVVNNLLMNAIKFSYEKSTILINLRLVKDEIVISVKDTGIGIPEKNKATVFDMFTESKMYGTSGEKPHGIGLSISLQVAKLHGGDIWFESEEGKGTTFFLSFPVNYSPKTAL